MSQTNSRERGEGIRLQKVLSQAGVASRRASEIMIDEGRVEVNGRIVTEQGMRVDPERDTIRVDGARIPAPRRHMYLLLNKPRGVVSTMDETEDRRTLVQYVPRHQRLYHVGRLDTDTEGLIILTNDGEFAHRLAHPSYEVRKTYLVEAEGKKALFTGDLSGGLKERDFPAYALEHEVDALICEMAHFDVPDILPDLERCRAKQVLFSHVFPLDKLERIAALDGRFGYPIRPVADGDVLEL